jgi:superoxide dismutase, Cu-Zn family
MRSTAAAHLVRAASTTLVLCLVTAGYAEGSQANAAAPTADRMNLGEPSPPGPPARPLAGTFTGTFADFPDPPKGTGKIGGTVTMVVSATRTVLTLTAAGLDDKASYVAHVHAQPCSVEEAGGHFRFDPTGPAAPPNEVWLTPITVTRGKGSARATADKPVNSDAKSVVIHLKRAVGANADEPKPPKLACADLTPKSQ